MWRIESATQKYTTVGGKNLPLWKICERQLGWWHSQLFLESQSKFHGSSHHQAEKRPYRCHPPWLVTFILRLLADMLPTHRGDHRPSGFHNVVAREIPGNSLVDPKYFVEKNADQKTCGLGDLTGDLTGVWNLAFGFTYWCETQGIFGNDP